MRVCVGEEEAERRRECFQHLQMVAFSLQFFSKSFLSVHFPCRSRKPALLHMHLLVKEPSKNLMKAMDLILRKVTYKYIFSHPSGDSETLWIPLSDMDHTFQLCPVMAHTENV